MRFVAAFLLAFFLLADIVTYVDENGRVVVTNTISSSKKSRKKRVYKRVNSSIYDAILVEKARKYGIDASLVKALITVESGFNPRAVSRKGAIGLMQLMPETAKLYGADDPFDPEQNIEAGVRYLSELLKKFKDKKLALAAYNAGESAVRKYGGIPPYRETKSFVKNVLALIGLRDRKTIIYRCVGKNGSLIVSNSPPLPEDCSGEVEIIR